MPCRMRMLWIAVVMAAGCGGGKKAPTAEQLHVQLAPIVEPKLQAIENLLKEPFPAATGSIKLDGPPLEMIREIGDHKIRGNALYAFEWDLRSLDRYRNIPLRRNFDGEYINDCFQIVRKKGLAGGTSYPANAKPWAGDEHIVGMKLPYCAATRYLLVIKIDEYKATEYIDKEKFGGGGAAAQVHVFDLDAGGKHLGGVPFGAQSSDVVTTHTIDSDLQANFYSSLQNAVKEHLPDASFR